MHGVVNGSQGFRVIQRTYSTNPAADSLKCALLRGNLEHVKNRIGVLPLGIDYQYVYFALARSPEVSTFFLESLFSHWLERVQDHPSAALESIIAGLKRLSQSFRLNELDHGFRLMLAKLRRSVLMMPCIVGDEWLLAQARQIPDYTSDENTLQMRAAYLAALHVSLDNLGEEVIALMAKARHRTNIAHPITSMDLSE